MDNPARMRIKFKRIRRFGFYTFLLVTMITILGGMTLVSKRPLTSQTSANTANEPQSQVLYDRIQYLDYSEQNLLSSRKFGRTLLFFAATTWCSNCIIIDENIKKRISEIPQDITILKVDYDNDHKMKAKYAVTQQTTLILLDNTGKEIKRWIGTSFDDLLENLN